MPIKIAVGKSWGHLDTPIPPYLKRALGAPYPSQPGKSTENAGASGSGSQKVPPRAGKEEEAGDAQSLAEKQPPCANPNPGTRKPDPKP